MVQKQKSAILEIAQSRDFNGALKRIGWLLWGVWLVWIGSGFVWVPFSDSPTPATTFVWRMAWLLSIPISYLIVKILRLVKENRKLKERMEATVSSMERLHQQKIQDMLDANTIRETKLGRCLALARQLINYMPHRRGDQNLSRAKTLADHVAFRLFSDEVTMRSTYERAAALVKAKGGKLDHEAETKFVDGLYAYPDAPQPALASPIVPQGVHE